jgi:hypothetical protein
LLLLLLLIRAFGGAGGIAAAFAAAAPPPIAFCCQSSTAAVAAAAIFPTECGATAIAAAACPGCWLLVLGLPFATLCLPVGQCFLRLFQTSAAASSPFGGGEGALLGKALGVGVQAELKFIKNNKNI